jgi:hypothetical protein
MHERLDTTLGDYPDALEKALPGEQDDHRL